MTARQLAEYLNVVCTKLTFQVREDVASHGVHAVIYVHKKSERDNNAYTFYVPQLIGRIHKGFKNWKPYWMYCTFEHDRANGTTKIKDKLEFEDEEAVRAWLSL